MYTSDQTQIRQGLVSYIGAIVKSSPFEGRAARHDAASILSEETLKLAQGDDETVDIYVLKPLLRATVFTLKQRSSELSELPNKEARSRAIQYKKMSTELENLINSIK